MPRLLRRQLREHTAGLSTWVAAAKPTRWMLRRVSTRPASGLHSVHIEYLLPVWGELIMGERHRMASSGHAQPPGDQLWLGWRRRSMSVRFGLTTSFAQNRIISGTDLRWVTG